MSCFNPSCGLIGCGTSTSTTWHRKKLGFNPSCGLIGCGTSGHSIVPGFLFLFQSLVRVDWLWNCSTTGTSTCWHPCFNPSCGLIGCGTSWARTHRSNLNCFNPSCGLIGCGTHIQRISGRTCTRFQSLVRVDWLWNSERAELRFSRLAVSIPRAG